MPHAQEELQDLTRDITHGDPSHERLMDLLFDAQRSVPGLAQFLRERSASDEENQEEMLTALLAAPSEPNPDAASAQPPPPSRDLPRPPADDSFFQEDVKRAELEAHRCRS